ncbi:helicase [Cyanosarcina cf. burmensis CCALA 770]|nr:helicase [Cyanosarcina cf. burmensis CCALA 770]
MIEVEVHYSLHNFLRSQAEAAWSHHLTMARLVARALRLGRSALIQVGAGCGYQGRYRLSYLAPALLWQSPAVIVATEEVQQRLLRVEIPPLQQWLQTNKSIIVGDRWIHPDFQGILLITPAAWLQAQWAGTGDFPPNIPTLIDGVDDLEDWARSQLTVSIHPGNWDELMLAYPDRAEVIREARVQLTKAVFRHPANPYECYLVSPAERNILESLFTRLGDKEDKGDKGDKVGLNSDFRLPIPDYAANVGEDASPPAASQLPNSLSLPKNWYLFQQRSQTPDCLLWMSLNRSQGLFSLYCAPAEVASALAPIWTRQPVVFMGSALDRETEATTYRKRLGLPEELTCLKFAGDRHNESIQLYTPERFPLPNTPQYQPALMREIYALIGATVSPGLTMILVGDLPLKQQIGAQLAAEFGSRVQVEKMSLDENSILVSGWDFWQQHQGILPVPQLTIITTLPIPSLEHPIVAGRVEYYKRSRQDWFALYLLPAALNQLQRAIAPMRERQGVVALLDSRVLHRSYGQQVLAALSPAARCNYLDASLFAKD